MVSVSWHLIFLQGKANCGGLGIDYWLIKKEDHEKIISYIFIECLHRWMMEWNWYTSYLTALELWLIDCSTQIVILPSDCLIGNINREDSIEIKINLYIISPYLNSILISLFSPISLFHTNVIRTPGLFKPFDYNNNNNNLILSCLSSDNDIISTHLSDILSYRFDRKHFTVQVSISASIDSNQSCRIRTNTQTWRETHTRVLVPPKLAMEV